MNDKENASDMTYLMSEFVKVKALLDTSLQIQAKILMKLEGRKYKDILFEINDLLKANVRESLVESQLTSKTAYENLLRDKGLYEHEVFEK
jgi:flagellar motor switch protein FliG